MDEQDDHYGPDTTRDGVHACHSTECMTRDVPMADLSQIGYALGVLADAIADTPIKTTVFRDDSGLYVLLTVDYGETGGSRAVIGAVYTPTMMAELRSRGYTLTYEEHERGVN